MCRCVCVCVQKVNVEVESGMAVCIYKRRNGMRGKLLYDESAC